MLHIVFIPHLQVIIPATWMVEDLAWEFLADRVGHAVVTMVAHGLETKDRFDAALTEVNVGLSCSALSYRQLDGVEGIHTAPVKQEPANEADEVEDEEEEETSEAEHESDPESYKSEDTEEYLPRPRAQGPGSKCFMFSPDDEDQQGNSSPGNEGDKDLGHLIDKLDSGSPRPVSTSRVNQTIRSPSTSPERPGSGFFSLSPIRVPGSPDKRATDSPGEVVPGGNDPKSILEPDGPDRPVGVGEAAGGDLEPPPVPLVAGGTVSVGWQAMMSDPVIMSSLLGLMNTIQVRGPSHRVSSMWFVQAAGFAVGPASTDVITPMRATTNRGLEHEGGEWGRRLTVTPSREAGELASPRGRSATVRIPRRHWTLPPRLRNPPGRGRGLGSSSPGGSRESF